MNTTTERAEPGHALADIEPTLYDMHAVIGMLGHIASSDIEPTSDQLVYLETRLKEGANRIEALWNAAHDEMAAEHAAHAAALAEAKAEAAEAAPGSVAQVKDVQALLSLLRAGNIVMAERIAEMESAASAALAERATEGQS